MTSVRNRLLSQYYAEWERGEHTIIVSRADLERLEEELHPCERFTPADLNGIYLPVPRMPVSAWPLVKEEGR